MPLSHDKLAPLADPRPQPEAGELEPERPPLLLPVPLFALHPAEAPAAAPGGGWDEESVLSWSESPRLAGLTEEVDSRSGGGPLLLSSHPYSLPLCSKTCTLQLCSSPCTPCLGL